MTPGQIYRRRVELGLSVAELAEILMVTERELEAVEAGQSHMCTTAAFEEAFAILEERAFATFVGA